ncbi:MAG: hypothetical protein LBU60_05120 [Clostridiales bacterium]|jgi:integrase|nr:hypothetical protein [Clostridiales bacterium]
MQKFFDVSNQKTYYTITKLSDKIISLKFNKLADVEFSQDFDNSTVATHATDDKKFKEHSKKENTMPPQFKDGHFRERQNKKSITLEYRFNHDNKLVSVYGKTEQECFDKRLSILTDKKKAKKQKTENYTVGSWVQFYFDTFKKSKNNTLSTNNYILLIKHISQNLPYKIDKVSVVQLQEFYNSLKDKPSKQLRISILLKSSFNKALKMRVIKYNPCEILETVSYKSKNHPLLNFEQQRKILKNLTKPKYKFIFMLCCCTGLRIGEVWNLDFDFNNFLITVKNKDTATKKHQRQIPFLPNNFITKNTINLLKQVKQKTTKNYFQILFKKLDIKAVFHSTRVTFISVCNYLNINPKQIQLWAGHSSITMTMDTYAKILKHDGTSDILDYLQNLKEFLKL